MRVPVLMIAAAAALLAGSVLGACDKKEEAPKAEKVEKAAAPDDKADKAEAPKKDEPAKAAETDEAEPKQDEPAKTAETDKAEDKAEGPAHYGAKFELDVEPMTLAKALEKGPDDKTLVKVSGKIDKVCKKKGCWMILTDGDQKARITFKDYGFTVPLDCDGSTAIVEGFVKTKVLSEAMVKHLAEDEGKDPNSVSGTRKEFQIVANGVDITEGS